MNYLGVTGKAGSGKDTACDYLAQAFGYQKLAFADPLRQIVAAVDPIIGFEEVADQCIPIRYNEALEFAGYQEAKQTYPEIRQVLQRVGTEGGRHVLGGDVWINASMRQVSKDRVCWSDVRFLNEARAIRRVGGKILRIVREDSGLDATAGQHASETELEKIRADYVIHNNGTPYELQVELDKLWKLELSS